MAWRRDLPVDAGKFLTLLSGSVPAAPTLAGPALPAGPAAPAPASPSAASAGARAAAPSGFDYAH
jgi:hypothetical protein